jgi:hypothetical protein
MDILPGLEETVPGWTRECDVMLNELMANNVATLSNAGEFPDWIELFNPADQPQSLSHMALTDDLSVPDKFRFPPGASIPSRGYLVVWCDDAAQAPGFHAGFRLSASGQTIGLSVWSGDEWVLKDTLTRTATPGFSIGRAGEGADWISSDSECLKQKFGAGFVADVENQ